MEFRVYDGPFSGIDSWAVIIFCDQSGKPFGDASGLASELAAFVESGEFSKKAGALHFAVAPDGMSAKRILFYGIGENAKPETYRKGAATALKALRDRGITQVALSLSGIESASDQRAAVEGMVLSNYHFTVLRSQRDDLPKLLDKLTIYRDANNEGAEQIQRWQAIAQGTLKARDLCQYPANIMDPTKMAEQSVQWGESCGYSTQILEQTELEKLKMGSLLSVSQGSVKPPKLIVMDYQPAKPSGKTFVFVGKAVTFDSGGLSLKPANSMAEMKGDMGGGAAVIGVMTVLRDAGCPHRVVGLVPAVENMPSGSATRPSDVVTSMSGLTIEINNTDAEGRLILADALTYAARYKPDYVVDFATLTGACLVALGPKVFAVMGNHQPLVDHILEAGKEVDEIFWQLPLVDEYNEMLKSNVADFANVAGSRWGGSITAGLFLQKFAAEYQWAHCDIAATIFDKPDAYRPAGGTGAGVRMAMAMLDRFS